MPSPFPGMDPYLEDPDLWPDVHGTLIPLIREAIRPTLPKGYSARIDQYVWLNSEDGELVRRGKPDVLVANVPDGGVATIQKSVTYPAPTEQVTLATMKKRRGNRFVEIVDIRRRKVVTVIELLSYSNKDPGDDRDHYLEKRHEYLANGTNLVEIDLLRGGSRLPIGHPKSQGDYYLMVTRADQYPKANLWTFTVLDPIPLIPVPLKPEHGAVPLDLKACLDRAYDTAGYADEIDYSQPAVPALRSHDGQWAAQLLKKQNRRKK